MRFSKPNFKRFLDNVGMTKNNAYNSSEDRLKTQSGFAGEQQKNAPGQSMQNRERWRSENSDGAQSAERWRSENSDGEQSTERWRGENSDGAQNTERWRSENSGGAQSETTPKGRCSIGSQTQDKGNAPVVINLSESAMQNENFREALWTGSNLQLTVMSIPVGEEIGIEIHDDIDQMIGVESGVGEVTFGRLKNNFSAPERINQNSVFVIPKGTYHNVKNIGRTPLKLYSVYAPKAHPFGTVEKTKSVEK